MAIGNSALVRAALMAGFAAIALAGGPASAQTPPAEPAAHDDTATPHYPLKRPERQDWSFSGILGKYDPAQLQRGLQVYKEVCSACHSLKRVAFRTLADKNGPHFPDDQMEALAASYQIKDGPNEQGEMFDRPGKPSDYFPSPFANAEAAKAANNGAEPPDLSLIAKARSAESGFPSFVLNAVTQHGEVAGANYIHALLTGYGEQPKGVSIPEGTHFNPYFLSSASLAMPPPLQDGQVSYVDGSPATVDQYSRDVAAFLTWAAEPHLAERKRIGFQAIIFLGVFAGLMYAAKRRIWAKVAGH